MDLRKALFVPLGWASLVFSFTFAGRMPSRDREPTAAGGSTVQVGKFSSSSWRASPLSLPVMFEPNVGQAGTRVRFLARGLGATWYFTPRGFVLAPPRANPARPPGLNRRNSVFQFRFLGANPKPAILGTRVLRARTSYFLGADPRHWHTSIPNYSGVRYSGLYPGVDAEFYIHEGELEFDLLVSAGRNPRRILLRIDGAERARMTPDGSVALKGPGGKIHLRRPAAYQIVQGSLRSVAARFVLRGRGILGFQVSGYDPSLPLMIDPSISISYDSFLGGSGDDSANGVAVDGSGNVYVGGRAGSTDFPEASTKVGATGTADLFAAKIDTTRSGANSLVYLVFLGGSGAEEGGAVAVDSQGELVILGTTTSSDFPVTDSSQRTSGPNDLTITKLNAAGTAPLFSTLLGGDGAEATQRLGGIAVDGSGNILVATDTTSKTGLPITAGAFQVTYGGGLSDGLLAKYSPTGVLRYCSYLGIHAQVGVSGLAADGAGNAYLAGFTSMPSGTSFPVVNGFQTVYGGGAFDAFVMKLNPVGLDSRDLIYSSLLGGSGSDQAFAISVDTATPPNAYLTGETQSSNFPTNGAVAPYQGTLKGAANAFVTVVRPSSSGVASLAYSTYLGGSKSDAGQDIAALSSTKVYVAGQATSLDFPTLNTLQPLSGTADAFVTKLDSTAGGAASLLYSTFLGGQADAVGNAVAATSTGDVFLAGKTGSPDFPQAAHPNNGFQPTCTSCSLTPPTADAFLAKITESSAPAPSVTFNPVVLNFGNQPVGSTSAAQILTLTNSGNAALSISSVSIAGANSGDFSQSNSCPIAPQTLAANGQCTISVTFQPSLAASEMAAVSVADNATGSPQAVPLSGTGTAPVAVASPASLNFGDQPQGSTSNTQNVTLSNAGNVTLHISGLAIIGTNSADFLIANNTCAAGGSVAPGGSCTVTVAFSPQAIGPRTAQLNLSDDSYNVPGSTQTAGLSGNGTPPAPVASLTPTALNFGSQTVGGASGAQTTTLRNSGSATLNLTTIQITGSNAADFQLVASGTNCPTQGGPLAVGASCTVAVRFAPQSPGAKSASVSFTDDAAGSPQSVLLGGTGTAPVVAFTPGSAAFAAQNVGTSSAPQNVTLANTGDAALVIGSIAVTGADSGDYSQTNNCPATLNAGNTCVFSVTFKPTGTGSRSASLTIADNAAGSPQSVPLSGTGTAPSATLNPSSLVFGNQLAGTTSSANPVSLANTGTGPLAIQTISFGGANPADFGESDNCGASVPAGSSCTIHVVFKPAGTGPRSGTLQVTDNALGSPQTVAVSGSGTDFSLGPASGAGTSLSIAAGQTASFKLQVTPENNFSGTVTLSCSGAPPAANCSAAPASVTISGAASAEFTISVNTTAHGFLIPGRWRDPRPPSGSPIAFLGALVLIGLGCGAQFASRARLRRLLLAGSGALLLLFLASCGGGTGAGGGGGTPPGTYTLTAAGNQQGASRQLSLTLTVQ